MKTLSRLLIWRRRHPLLAWLAAFAFWIATPFPPAEWAITLGAQTVAVYPTTSQAILSLDPITILVSSTTGITGFSGGQPTTVCLADNEILIVRTVINSTSMTVTRGGFSTRPTTHGSGIQLVCTNPAAVYAYIPSGQCLRTNLQYVPWITGGQAALGAETGNTWDCLGVGAAGQWTQTDGVSSPVVGSTVASATSITPTGTFFKVSGTVAIATIVVPAGWAPGLCLTLQPTGIFTTTTAGNINLASTAVVNKLLFMCFDGTKWNPSY